MDEGLFQPEGKQPAKQTAVRGYARVVVERGIDRPSSRFAAAQADSSETALTYAVVTEDVAIGQRVIVPLGKGNKPTAGIVLALGGSELAGDFPLHEIKSIAKTTTVRLTPTLVTLGQWISEYYVCPLGMVFSTMLPAAVKKQTGQRSVTLLSPMHESEEPSELPSKLASIWQRICEVDTSLWPLTPKALLAVLNDPDDAIASTGSAGALSPVGPASIRRLIDAGKLRAERVDAMGQSAMAGGRTWEDDHLSPRAVRSARHDLTAGQHEAIQRITAQLDTFVTHLLFGVTGSGKTEVYLRVIEQMLSSKPESTAIMLVPEISLTPQTAQRFVDRFGPLVAVLHSGLTGTQRHAQWLACAQGRVRVVVGARSAIFAPLNNVGLVVVDEEHDSSYKQDQLPRYSARDTAIKRAQLHNCPCVLGSATPSLESWANAQPGFDGQAKRDKPAKYVLSVLTDRPAGAQMPRVEVVDLAQQRRLRALVQPEGWRDRHLHLLGPTLEGAIGETLTANGQVILLLNRRGYANYICCTDPSCGWVMQCEHCDVTTVYHVDRQLKTGGFVRCHHCLAELQLPAACPDCKKPINTFGLGTQRVEAELERKFALSHKLETGQTLLRLDGDSMRTAKDYFSALSRFAAGEVKVLVGTQMIAKGLDFPNVRLVGIVSADTSINLPDFRAAERTFQLVAQVSGRAGRGVHPGRVIVQTMNPDEPAIVLASSHNFERFAEQELAHRLRAGLPPITRMARIVCRDLDVRKAQGAALALVQAMRPLAYELSVSLRGPIPCSIARIGDHHRIAVELLASARTQIQRVMAAARSQGLLISDNHTAVDVDPVALM